MFASLSSCLSISSFFNLFYRLQTIYRLAHGGRSYKIDIYLRNWSIRTELQRRAYLYNIENNESFHEAELSVATTMATATATTTTMTSMPVTINGRGTRNETTGNSMLTSPPLNFSNDATVDSYKNKSNDEQNDDGGRDHTNLQDSTYHKQYCNEDVKTIEMRANIDVSIAARKTLANDLQSESAILCGKHVDELIVDDRCVTWNKSVRNCSEKKAAQDAKVAATAAATTTSVGNDAATSTTRKHRKQCISNPLTTCEIGKTSKAPKLQTQNTFISRLFLTDILDNI